jgi:hypothetical protein
MSWSGSLPFVRPPQALGATPSVPRISQRHGPSAARHSNFAANPARGR